MSNFEKWYTLIESYSELFDVDISEDIKCSLRDSSYDETNNVYLYDSQDGIEVIKLDAFAKNIYYKIYGNHLQDNTLNSADAFLINKDNDWYLIEFKDAPIKTNKNGILKKAFFSFYMLMDILYQLKDSKGTEFDFDYNNPFDFFRNNVKFILVCSKNKNYKITERNIGTFKACNHYYYTPPFMETLKSYFFKDAIIYTEDYFKREFISGFKYE